MVIGEQINILKNYDTDQKVLFLIMHSLSEEEAGVSKGSSISTFEADDPERQGSRLLCSIKNT